MPYSDLSLGVSVCTHCRQVEHQRCFWGHPVWLPPSSSLLCVLEEDEYTTMDDVLPPLNKRHTLTRFITTILVKHSSRIDSVNTAFSRVRHFARWGGCAQEYVYAAGIQVLVHSGSMYFGIFKSIEWYRKNKNDYLSETSALMRSEGHSFQSEWLFSTNFLIHQKEFLKNSLRINEKQ